MDLQANGAKALPQARCFPGEILRIGVVFLEKSDGDFLPGQAALDAKDQEIAVFIRKRRPQAVELISPRGGECSRCRLDASGDLVGFRQRRLEALALVAGTASVRFASRDDVAPRPKRTFPPKSGQAAPKSLAGDAVRFVGEGHVAEEAMEEGSELRRETRKKQVGRLRLSTREHQLAHFCVELGDIAALLRIVHDGPHVR
jgi:hypothetical protein